MARLLAKINVGVVGLGHMGLLHMANCLHIDDVEVVAVADSSTNALKRVEPFGVKNLHRDYHSFFDRESKNLDAVVISLPNFLHYDSVRRAVETGLDVFVEKPLATNLVDGRKIATLVRKKGSRLMVGHCMRFIDAIGRMKDATDEGHIGSLEIITIESIQNGPLSHGLVPRPVSDWWFDPRKSGGGALLDIGYHLIDLFRFFAGDSDVLFSCLDHKYNLPVEDGATVILNSHEPSIRGIINVGWFERTILPRFNFRLILHGNADYLSSDELMPRNIYVHALKEGTKNFLRKVIGKRIQPLSYLYYYEAYYRELAEFFRSIKEDSDPPVSAVDGLRTLEIIDEAYRISDGKLDGRKD